MKKILSINAAVLIFIISSAVLTGILIKLETLSLYKEKPITTLEKIRKTGKIRLITDNNANTYYIYRDTPMGFEYDMAKAFADFIKADLEVVIPGWNRMFNTLEHEKGDFIAAGLTITENRKERVSFSQPYLTVQQKLIHHKLIFGAKTIEDLSGRTIHVRKNTSYHTRLKEIQDSGIDITIKLHDNIPTEEFIRMVAERKIKYTIADSNIALLNRRYYPDIRIGLPVHEQQSLGWAVRKNDTALLEKIDLFLETAQEKGVFGKIYEKHYGDIDIFDYFDLKKFHERINTRLPKYKPAIIRESEKFNFDWRMIAAVIYQESHYDPMARSRTGVKGLMQITRETAKEMGIKNRIDPEQSIKGGIRYLYKMYKRFNEIKNREERLLFALASYNVGYGHVRDAQKIAVKKGLDKNRWRSLKKILPLLTQRRYYKETKHGYARGWEPVTYVDRILTYYDILKQKANKA
ncbi:MAG: membrane-bound lytic murein transglycosylase MltF [Thermodesulfobacteriota bacterium]|nr:membrane-bound lytic murein transglycosylase MltF [Thermodesulfobacteriota bacterium]